MKETPTNAIRIEPRWPVALERIWLFPHWTPYVVTIAMLVPMAAVPLTAAKAQWLCIEHTITFLFFMVVAGATLSNLIFLTRAMVHRPEAIDGIQLLSFEHRGVDDQRAGVLAGLLADRPRRP